MEETSMAVIPAPDLKQKEAITKYVIGVAKAFGIQTPKVAFIAATEQVVVPEYGARLGNFTAVNIDADHAYVSVAEWMQTLEPAWHECEVCEKYGANNRSWYVELRH